MNNAVIGSSAPPPARNTERYGKPVVDYPSLEAFLEREEYENAIHQIHVGAQLVEFLLVNGRKNAPLVINYHAALSSASYTLPYFTGLNITHGLGATQVCVSDPSLALTSDLKLSWYAGNEALDFQKIWRTVVEHLSLVYAPSHRIHFGASGGGFAALYFGHDQEDTLSVAVNPQTSIGAYIPRVQRQFTRICFGATTEEQHHDVLRSRTVSDLTQMYTGPFRNTVVYLQNVLDDHLGTHFQPFVAEARHHGDVYANLHDWGRGHVPPPQGFLKVVLSTLVRPTWLNTLDTGNYVHNPAQETVSRVIRKWENRW